MFSMLDGGLVKKVCDRFILLSLYYLALQLPSLVHRDIILTLYAFDRQYAPFRHRPDLQDTCHTVRKMSRKMGWIR